MKLKKKMPVGKKVSGMKYVEEDEEYDKKKLNSSLMKKQPADIAGAISKSKKGYSDKPRVKASKKK